MQDFAHLNQFGSLVSDCEWWLANFTSPGHPASSMIGASVRPFLDHLLRSQRFICPDIGTKFVGEVPYHERHISLMKLPFDDVAVLYMEPISGSASEAIPCVTVYSKTLLPPGDYSEDAFGALTAYYAGAELEAFLQFASRRSFGFAGKAPAGAKGWIILKPLPTVIDPAQFSPGHGLAVSSALLNGAQWPQVLPPPPSFENTVARSDSGAATREVAVIIDLCCALACSNVHSRRVGRSDEKAVRRARAGKKPLFSYNVLEIDVDPSEQSSGPGITGRASPRTHLRRGHIRHLSSGQLVWVNAAVVRGKTPGIVVKDYRVGR